ncbi:MAG: hypothetical protein WBB17_14155 [Saprospiraceae bacterium]|nr:hypothetical protein [Saprospiraceae bacterium]
MFRKFILITFLKLGFFLFSINSTAQKTISQDSIFKIEKKTELIIENLKAIFNEREDQQTYLIEEKKRYLSNRDQIIKINKQIASVISENKTTKAYIDAYEELLTRIRQLNFRSGQEKSKEIHSISAKHKILLDQKLEIDFDKVQTLPKVVQDEPLLFQVKNNCSLEKNRDNNLVSTRFENLFSYTDPKIESYFIDKEFVTCESRLIKSQKNILLELRLKFSSIRAGKIYGTIDPSNPIKLTFLNDDFIYLRPSHIVTANIEEKTGNTIYKIQIPLDKEKQKKIKKFELDKIIFLFTSGKESFDIYNFDLLKNMLLCIKKK